MALAADKKLFKLVVEVDTDEAWKKRVLKQPALSVVDVWSEWAGPCDAMRSHLLRFKLTDGGDDLHLFSANASTITALSRFQDHAEPTWMLFGSGQLVNIYVGCNKPALIKMVRSELARERNVLLGKAHRKVLSEERLVALERRRGEAQAARMTKAQQAEKNKMEADLRAIRLRQYRSIAQKLPNHTVVLFLPHTLDQGRLPEVADVLEDTWLAMGVYVERTVRVALTEEFADEVFWERRLPQHAALVESLGDNGGLCAALLLRRGRPQRMSFPMDDMEGEAEEDEDAGGCGDAPLMSEARRHSNVAEDDDDDEVARPGLVERLVAESVYGFYPGSVSNSAPNDSLSEFFSPVGGAMGGGGASPAGTPPLQTSPLVSASAMTTASLSRYRRSTATWVQQSSFNLARLNGRTVPGLDEVVEEHAEWDDHDMAEYEGSVSLGSPLDQSWPKELRPVADSAAAALLLRVSDMSLVLPGLWTPLTPLSKAAGLRVLFPELAGRFYKPEEVVQQVPSIIVCFRAFRRVEVLETAANYINDILHLGFFTEDRKLLARTPGEYDALHFKGARDKLALALAETAEGALLELADHGPIYISPTANLARIDLEEFFIGRVETALPRLGSQGGEGDGDADAEETEDIPEKPVTPGAPPVVSRPPPGLQGIQKAPVRPALQPPGPYVKPSGRPPPTGAPPSRAAQPAMPAGPFETKKEPSRKASAKPSLTASRKPSPTTLPSGIRMQELSTPASRASLGAGVAEAGSAGNGSHGSQVRRGSGTSRSLGGQGLDRVGSSESPGKVGSGAGQESAMLGSTRKSSIRQGSTTSMPVSGRVTSEEERSQLISGSEGRQRSVTRLESEAGHELITSGSHSRVPEGSGASPAREQSRSVKALKAKPGSATRPTKGSVVLQPGKSSTSLREQMYTDEPPRDKSVVYGKERQESSSGSSSTGRYKSVLSSGSARRLTEIENIDLSPAKSKASVVLDVDRADQTEAISTSSLRKPSVHSVGKGPSVEEKEAEIGSDDSFVDLTTLRRSPV